MAGSTPKPRGVKKAKDVAKAKAYSPRAEAQAYRKSSGGSGYIENTDSPADEEFKNVSSELLAAVGSDDNNDASQSSCEDVLGLDKALSVTLELNPEYGSYCFKLDGGVEYNIAPTIINTGSCIVAEGSSDLPAKATLIKVEGRLVVAETHDNIVDIVKMQQSSNSSLTLMVSPMDDKSEGVTIQDVLASTGKDPLTVEVVDHVRNQVHSLTTPYTTRPIKPNEEEGVEYHFVHEAVFRKMIANGDFFEHTTKDGFYYGSPLPHVADIEPVTEASAKIRRRRSYDMLDEATVAHVLEDMEVAPEVLKHLEGQTVNDIKASELSLSGFLEAIGNDEKALEEVRDHVRKAIYEVTVPFTTRAPREGEKDGREYNFVSVAEFKALIDSDRMLEYGVHNNALYGTLKVNKASVGPNARTKRSETLRKALVSKHQGVKVGELMKFSEHSTTALHDSVKHHSVAHFLSSVPHDDEVFGEFRSKVKAWLYDCTIPYTTRPPRDTEVPGRDYHFIELSEFQDMVAHDRFIEYGEHNGNWYGTLNVDTEHVAHSSEQPRLSRSSAKRKVLAAGLEDVKVHHLLGTEALPIHVSESSLVEFLRTAPEDDSDIGTLRAGVKHALYDVTVPITTRAMREGERNGREYHFVSREQFTLLCTEHKMLEFGVYNDELYGTLKPTIEDIEGATFKRSSMSMGALTHRTDEATMEQVSHLITSPPSDLHKMLPVSQFFAHVGPDSEEHSELRHELKNLIYDMTVPYTTRTRREGEREGHDYHFVTVDQFQRLYNDDIFLEVGEVSGDFYGTPKLMVDDLDNSKQPQLSRKLASAERMANSTGEVTMGFFADQHNISELEQHSDIPLSLWLSRVSEDHEVHGKVRAKVKAHLYESTIPVTTRPRREGEKDGREYHFVTDAQFADMISKHEFVEYGKRENGFYYGTPLFFEADARSENPYRRSEHLKEVHIEKSKHATIRELIPHSTHPALEQVGGLSVSHFLSRVDADIEEYSELRDEIKSAIYAATTPYTTREIRPNEQDGIEYHFVTKAEFKQKVEDDQFLEWGEHSDQFYGTPHILSEELQDGGIHAKLKERKDSLQMAINEAPQAKDALEHLEEAVKREEALRRRLEAMKTVLATRDEQSSDDDLRLLVDKLHVLAHGDDEDIEVPSNISENSSAAVDAGPAEAERETVATPPIVPTVVQVQDTEHARLHQDLMDHKEKLSETTKENAELTQKVNEHEETISNLKVQAKIMDINKTLNNLDKLHDFLNKLPNISTSAASDGTPAAATGPTQPSQQRDLPTVTADMSAWNKPDSGRPKLSIKEKLAARRNWQQVADATATMSPLKAKLKARRRAKAEASGGGVHSTGNGTPAMGLVASELMNKQRQPHFDEQEPAVDMSTKSISPSPRQTPLVAKLLDQSDQHH